MHRTLAFARRFLEFSVAIAMIGVPPLLTWGCSVESNASEAPACASGLVDCDGSCVETLSDAQNCGQCGLSCPAGQVCSQGSCATECASGLTLCGGDCADLGTSATNCGQCGRLCDAGQACQSGVCQGGTGGPGGSGGSSAGTGGSGGSGAVAGSGGTGVSGGGIANSGGTSSGGTSSGGTISTGGSGTGSCAAPPSSACTAPEVRITEVDLGTSIIPNGFAGDTDPIPVAIAPMPGGGSRIAWMSGFNRNGTSTGTQVHVAELDCDDQLVGTPFSFEAYDFTDVAADADGGVVLLTRDADGSGAENCGDINNLCGIPNDPIGCYDMFLVRFDNAGNEVWATKLTSSDQTNPPYTADNGWNHFIWWYQHRGRIAYDGTNYASYFCDAITVQNNTCVDIHQGDRMKVVDPSGTLLDGHDSFDGGCSHSWNVRMVWDDRVGHFVMVCATDNPAPGQHRIARPSPYRTVWPSPGPDGSLSMGDLVMSTASGYWITASAGGSMHLLHFEEELYDQDIDIASTDFSHLVSYGAGHMIVSWASGGSMSAEVRDRATGDLVGSQFTIGVPDHRYVSFEAFPDGSVAYPAEGTTDHSVRIARVMPCSG